MFKREIISTEDGSTTFFIPEWNESYHSKHGAIQEAYHVFIRNGLDLLKDKKEISLLEIGFGTGLNALISCLESDLSGQKVNYTGLEKYPISKEELNLLNYSKVLVEFNPELKLNEEITQNIHSQIMNSTWESFQEILSNFNLKKIQTDFLEFTFPENEFDLVYFDAFGARVQPELWTSDLFQKIYNSMKLNGIFTTYSSKGSVRRALLEVGFEVQKHPGPPGKREMLIARK